eukprot:Lithocolla_globosa_v1_NODE_1336_length_2662_cov_7.344074.p4 type:complete len:119 gc:universal NODE_1336_length_2662_cov_7.344074:1883-2239(+)
MMSSITSRTRYVQFDLPQKFIAACFQPSLANFGLFFRTFSTKLNNPFKTITHCSNIQLKTLSSGKRSAHCTRSIAVGSVIFWESSINRSQNAFSQTSRVIVKWSIVLCVSLFVRNHDS